MVLSIIMNGPANFTCFICDSFFSLMTVLVESQGDEKAIQSLIHLRLEGEVCAADDLPGYSGTALLCLVHKAEKTDKLSFYCR